MDAVLWTQTTFRDLQKISKEAEFGNVDEIVNDDYLVFYAYCYMSNSVVMQYSIFVTNKTKDIEHLYVCLRGDKLQEWEQYSRLLDEMSINLSLEKETSAGIGGKEGASVSEKGKAGLGYSRKTEEEHKILKKYASLIQGNFSRLNANQPTPFAVEDVTKIAYLSVHDEEKMWVIDFPVNPGSYGCITIKGNKDGITAHPSNPKPVWTACKRGDPLPEKAIYGGKTNADGDLYFGRVTSYSGIPCKVNVSDGKLCYNWWYTYNGEGSEKKGDVLIDTGFELVRAFRGDMMPPNAIMTGATNKDNSLFVGRAGGNVPCKINLKDGKIWNFWYSNRGENSAESGEVLLLINDPKH